MANYIVSLNEIGMADSERVGGKNASLGEMIRHLGAAGVKVPGGFATTAQAYRDFIARDALGERINERLASTNVDNVVELVAAGKEIRSWINEATLQPELSDAIETAYRAMSDRVNGEFSVAVRSSATAEDLPQASFAGQQETYLNVRGLDQVRRRVKDVYASLFNDRAISYRVHQRFDHKDVALSAAVQRMVRSDIGTSGVMFTLDTESGFRDVVFITASYGLGELLFASLLNLF